MKAISIKFIELQPMSSIEAYNKGYKIDENSIYRNEILSTEGYEITYENGYKSWCPKVVVENYYLIYDIEKEKSIDLFKTKVRGFLNKVLEKIK